MVAEEDPVLVALHAENLGLLVQFDPVGRLDPFVVIPGRVAPTADFHLSCGHFRNIGIHPGGIGEADRTGFVFGLGLHPLSVVRGDMDGREIIHVSDGLVVGPGRHPAARIRPTRIGIRLRFGLRLGFRDRHEANGTEPPVAGDDLDLRTARPHGRDHALEDGGDGLVVGGPLHGRIRGILGNDLHGKAFARTLFQRQAERGQTDVLDGNHGIFRQVAGLPAAEAQRQQENEPGEKRRFLHKSHNNNKKIIVYPSVFIIIAQSVYV